VIELGEQVRKAMFPMILVFIVIVALLGISFYYLYSAYQAYTSGLLNDEIGGPSVKPYQPPGLWEETNAGGNRGILTSYVEDTGDKLYRRSLYTFWKRTLPPPSMTIFDAPNRDLCEVRRQKTNTPLQALALQAQGQDDTQPGISEDPCGVCGYQGYGRRR